MYFENVGGAVWQAVLPLLNDFARVPVCGLIAQYNGPSGADTSDRLPATMRQILSKSLTLRGFINYEFVEQHYAEFLREVGAGITAASDIVKTSSTVWRKLLKHSSGCSMVTITARLSSEWAPRRSTERYT